jgi:hypothetical protein
MPKMKQFHMVGLAPVCWAPWKDRNTVCFNGKRINSPAEIICLVSSFISYRAGLQKAEDKTTLEMGVGALKDAALISHLSVLGSVPPTLERFCFSKPLLR